MKKLLVLLICVSCAKEPVIYQDVKLVITHPFLSKVTSSISVKDQKAQVIVSDTRGMEFRLIDAMKAGDHISIESLSADQNKRVFSEDLFVTIYSGDKVLNMKTGIPSNSVIDPGDTVGSVKLSSTYTF